MLRKVLHNSLSNVKCVELLGKAFQTISSVIVQSVNQPLNSDNNEWCHRG